jgi:hypothetical protein
MNKTHALHYDPSEGGPAQNLRASSLSPKGNTVAETIHIDVSLQLLAPPLRGKAKSIRFAQIMLDESFSPY